MLEVLRQILAIDIMTIYKIHSTLVDTEKIRRSSLTQCSFRKYRFGSIAEKSEYKNNMDDQCGGKHDSRQ